MSAEKNKETVERYCIYCEFGTPIPGSKREADDVICPKKGLVRGDFVCRKFRYDPLKRNPKEKKPLPAYDVIQIDD